ncbi:hypothetical protein PhCBS80983_g03982 [Powellomyces hirtus]|uniref:Uncharacterized protein n=1 Tax=Powellomyces hirtus TaxID=109895 RepID=A0A507E223_9FUNG|nr:hypothetical protein PhCBS80983_g03982 [Powellomyces hirtus]
MDGDAVSLPPTSTTPGGLLRLFIDRTPLFQDDSDYEPPRRKREDYIRAVAALESATHPVRKRHIQRDDDGGTETWTWAKVKRDISHILGVIPRTVDKSKTGEGTSEGDCIEPPRKQGAASAASQIQSLTVPHGLQHIHTIPTAQQVKNVLYVPSGVSPYNYTPTQEMWAVWDEIGVGVWCRGRGKRISAAWIAKGVVGWKAVAGWVVVAGGDMCLRVLDQKFEEICVVGVGKPLLFLDWIPERNELVTGEVGSITFWNIENSFVSQRNTAKPVAIRKIHDLADEEWVSYILYDATGERCYAAVDSSVYVYDWTTGDRLETLQNIHEMSVTCLAYHKRLEYLISGSKDGEIKVWSPQSLPIYSFRHTNSISSLLLPYPTVPVVMSGSLDGSVRMWDLDRGKQTYKVNVGLDVRGLMWVGQDAIGVWGKKEVGVWSLSRVGGCFIGLSANPQTISMLHHPRHPSRIIATLSDGSVRICSPVTGNTLTTCFPVYKDVALLDAVADMEYGAVYGILSSGEVGVWDISGGMNPGVLRHVWEEVVPRDTLTSLTAIDIYNHVPASSDPTTTAPYRRNFYLGVGMESGGIGWVNENGRLEGSVQAHIAPVVFVRFDAKRLWVISGGEDFTIKTWFFSPPTSSSVTHSTSSTKSPLLPTLIHLHTITTPSTHLTPAIAVSPTRGLLGVPGHGSIKGCRYDTDTDGVLEWADRKDEAARMEEGGTGGEVRSVDWCESWGLWAGGVGRVVRVWDEGGLIREIQFNDTVRTVCFGNERGDIFVGISDQISLVRMQDYLPHHLLRIALTRTYIDDPKEDSRPFDSNVDFWEGVLERNLRERGTVGYWHVKRDVDKMKGSLESSGSAFERRRDLDDRETIMRRNRRLFLAREQHLFAYNRSHALLLKEIRTRYTERQRQRDDGERCEGEDFVLWDEDEDDEGGLFVPGLRAGSPSEEVVEKVEFVPPSVVPEYVPKKSKKNMYIKPQSRRTTPSLMKPPSKPSSSMDPTLTKEEVDARRAEVRRNLQSQGVTLPNSTLTQDVAPPHKKPAFKMANLPPPHSGIEPPVVKYIVPASRARGKPVKEEPKLWTAPGLTVGALMDDLEDEENAVAAAPDDAGGNEDEVPPPPSPPMFAEIEVAKPRVRRPARHKKAAKKRKVKQPKPVVPPLLLPPPVEIPAPPPKPDPPKPQKPQPLPVPIPELKPVVVSDRKVIPSAPAPRIKETPLYQPRKPAVVTNIPADPTPRPPPPAPPKPTPSPPPPKPPPKEHPRPPPKQPDPPPVKTEAVLEPEEEEEKEKPVAGDMGLDFLTSRVDEQEAAAFAWNLIRLRGKNTLQAIVSALITLLSTGFWLEKVEASKALLFLYRTFQADFLDPMAVLIRPQLEHLHDEHWQVRAQLCVNLAQYGIRESELVIGFMALLADEVEFVRAAALRALASCGVHSRRHLEEAMRSCGVLPRLEREVYRDVLSTMLASTHDRIHASRQDAADLVQTWLGSLSGTPRSTTSKSGIPHFKRRNSYFEHLAGAFFPPDNKNATSRTHTHDSRNSRDAVQYMDWDDGVPKGWDTLDHHHHTHGQDRRDHYPDIGMVARVFGPSARAAEPSTANPTPHYTTHLQNHHPATHPLRLSTRAMRPMTAGAMYARGGRPALEKTIDQPVLKQNAGKTVRPLTAPSAKTQQQTTTKVKEAMEALMRNVNAGQGKRGWANTLRPNLPPVDTGLHDRPFRT